MKLKYKKIILLTTMSTMGIGLLTLSINHDQTKAQERLKPDSKQEATETFMESILEESTDFAMASVQVEDMVETASEPTETPVAATPTPTPEPSPTPKVLPVYPLKEMPELDALLVEYFNAKAGRDLSKLKSLYSDPSKAETMEQLESKVKFIEEYKSIKTYGKQGYEEGSFIIYVYHDIKFTRINTLAPGLSKFYLVTNSAGEIKFYSEDKSPELEAYYHERNMDEDVLELIEMTDQKSLAMREKDEDLMIFWSELDKYWQQ